MGGRGKKGNGRDFDGQERKGKGKTFDEGVTGKEILETKQKEMAETWMDERGKDMAETCMGQ